MASHRACSHRAWIRESQNLALAVLLALVSAGAVQAGVSPVTLNDNLASLDLINQDTVSAVWGIDGNDVLFLEVGIANIAFPVNLVGIGDTNMGVDPRDDAATFEFLNEEGERTALVSLLLRGNFFDGTQSDLAQTIELTNLTDEDLEFFQEVEIFADNKTVAFPNDNTVRVTAPGLLFEEVYTPTAEVGSTSDTDFFLTWTVPAGETITISKDAVLTVPEPGTILLMALGLIGLTFRRHR